MDNTLAIVPYQPSTAANTTSSPPPESQNGETDNRLAIVVYNGTRKDEASNSTQKKRKERVKAMLKNCVPFSPEELPAGLNPGSIYYKGTSIGLPKGWLIEQRPRSNRKADQFFLAPRTGKQFRSLIEVRKFLGNQQTDNEPDDEPETEEFPFAEVISRTKRRKGTQRPLEVQPLRQFQPEPEPFDYKNPPNSVSWSLQDPKNKVWIPEVPTAERSKDQWTKAFNSFTNNPNSQATGCRNSEDGNNGGRDFKSS